MPEYRDLLDAFANARRSWDDLVGLQPDVRAGSGNLQHADLAELERLVRVHSTAIDLLTDALEAAWGDHLDERAAEQAPQREGTEVREEVEEADDPLLASAGGGQTSHKAGTRALAQKAARSRHPDRSAPSSRKVAGAFGKEPPESSSE